MQTDVYVGVNKCHLVKLDFIQMNNNNNNRGKEINYDLFDFQYNIFWYIQYQHISGIYVN